MPCSFLYLLDSVTKGIKAGKNIMDYLTHEDLKAQNSKVICPNVCIILPTVPYLTRGFQDEHLEKAKAAGSIVYEDLGESKNVCG